jgi:hypothetical protein
VKDKSLIGHTLFAVAAAIAAYAAWAEPSTSGDADASVVMVPGDPDRLTKVEWEDDGWRVALDRAGEDWKIAVTELPKQENPEAPVSAGPVADKAKVYPAADRARDLIKDIAPLQAARSLGAVTGDKLAGLGLDKPSSKLVLHYGESVKTVEVGGSTFGTGDRYARVPGADEIFLLRANTLASLKHGASGLVDRTALGIAQEKIERVTIAHAGKTRELVQRHADDKAKAFWADRAEPDVKLEQATAWLDRVLKLRIADLADTQPVGEAELTVELWSGQRSLGTLALWGPDDKQSLAKSSRFDTPVTVTKANSEAVLRDVGGVLDEGK